MTEQENVGKAELSAVGGTALCPKTGFQRKVCFCEKCRPIMTQEENAKLIEAVIGRRRGRKQRG